MRDKQGNLLAYQTSEMADNEKKKQVTTGHTLFDYGDDHINGFFLDTNKDQLSS